MTPDEVTRPGPSNPVSKDAGGDAAFSELSAGPKDPAIIKAELARAVEYINAPETWQNFDAERYRQTLEFLVDNREQLSQRVYIQLPGGLSGNSDSQWNHVKEHSTERCGCGNERVILPGNQRTEYEPSPAGEVAVTAEAAVYLKPVGGDKASAYVMLKIEQGALTFMQDPFAPFVFTPDIFSTRGYKLDKLAEILPEQPKPPVFVMGKEKAPIFAITAVDAESGRATIVPDKGVEIFDPDKIDDKGHANCGS